jgi:curli biogenesis system outer membrane secretion channel CsgG
MKKFVQKLAVAALSLSVLSACQTEGTIAMIAITAASAKTAVAAPTSMAIAAPNVNTASVAMK